MASLDFKVTISEKAKPVAEELYHPLIFSGNEAAEIPYTECTTLEEVGALFDEDTNVHQAAALVWSQNALANDLPPGKIAVYGGTGTAVDSLPNVWQQPWRHLIVAGLGEESESTVHAIAALVEERGDAESAEGLDKKIFFARVSDLSEVSGDGNSIVEYERTFCLYYPSETPVCPEAAVAGKTAGKPLGSISYKNKIVADVPASDLTNEQIKAAHDLGCYCIVKKAGQVVTSEGKVGEGEYVDVVDGKDYIINNMEYDMQAYAMSVDKIPFDNNGIAVLESICLNVLNDGVQQGIIATTDAGVPDYNVNFAPRSATTEEERETRTYTRGEFDFRLAGAIHNARVHGIVEV